MAKNNQKFRRVTRLALGAGAVVAGLTAGWPTVSDAALLVDLKIISSTNGTSQTTKSVTLTEGGTVTVGLYLYDFDLAAGNTYGLAGVQYSIRSSGEKYGTTGGTGGTALTPITATDTILNATAYSNALPAKFVVSTGEKVVDINSAISNPDPNDTDIDVFNAGGTQQAGPRFEGFGNGTNGGAGWLIGTATFTAADLAEATRPMDRVANLNTYFTAATGTNGGLVLKGFSSSDVNSVTQNTTNRASATIIGSNVLVLVGAGGEPPANNSNLSIPGSLALRVMQGSPANPALAPVSNSGTDEGKFSATTTGGVSLAGTSGSVAGGGKFDLGFGWGDTAAPGARTGSIILVNSANPLDTDNLTANVTGAVVAQRVVGADPISLGRQMAGVDLSLITGQSATFRTDGSHDERTDIRVNGHDFKSAEVISLPVTGNGTLVAGGTFASLPVTKLENLPGEGAYADVTVGYTATPVTKRDVTAQSISFGRVVNGNLNSLGAQTVILNANGGADKTFVTVGGVLVDGSAPTVNVTNVTGPATPIAASGTFATLAVVGEGLTDEGLYTSVQAPYTATPIDKRTFAPITVNLNNLLKGAQVSVPVATSFDGDGSTFTTPTVRGAAPVAGLAFNSNNAQIVGGPVALGTITGRVDGNIATAFNVQVDPEGNVLGEGTYAPLTVNVNAANVGRAFANNSNVVSAFGPALSGFVPAGGSFAGIESSTNDIEAGTSGGAGLIGTTATFREGAAGAPGNTISMSWRTRTNTNPLYPEDQLLLSDVVQIVGMEKAGGRVRQLAEGVTPHPVKETDVFVLQMSYDQSVPDTAWAAVAVFDLGSDFNYGGIGDAADRWVFARELNWDNNSEYATTLFNMSWDAFRLSHTGDLSGLLGAQGYDPGTHTAWAVLNHNSDFAVVPEPSSLAMGLMGLGMLGMMGWRRARRNAQ